MMLKYRVFGWLKTKTTVQRNHGVGINKLIRTPVGVVQQYSVQPRLKYAHVDCHKVLMCSFCTPIIVVIDRLVDETIAT